MKHKSSQLLYSYWNGLRRDRPAPRRFEIEPSRIASILPDTFILERVGDVDVPSRVAYTFRLAGTRICEQFGQELRGANLLDLWDDRDRLDVEAHLADVVEHGTVAVLTFSAVSATGRNATFEAVILPLMHTKPFADRFLGAMSCIDLPIWLGTERLISQHVRNWDTIWPDDARRRAQQGAGRQPPFHPAMAQARVVRSDRRLFRVLDGGLGKPGAPKM